MTARAFQSLPRHLRRRAASHNPRRVPKRLRQKAAFEVSMRSPPALISEPGVYWSRSNSPQIDKGDKTVKVQRKKAEKRRKKGIKGMSVTERWLGRQRESEPPPLDASRPCTHILTAWTTNQRHTFKETNVGWRLTCGMRNEPR
jgi:ribonuclease P/MRP protein subunit POP1